MKHIIRFFKRLFGYEYFKFYVEYDYISHKFKCVCIEGDTRNTTMPLDFLCAIFKIPCGDLQETLIDTVTLGHIYQHGFSYITLEVKKGKFRVVESSKTP